jgi:CBS domain-containing protein
VRLLADTAADLMTPQPFTVADSATVDQVTASLIDRGYGAAVVIDPAGRPVGVVTKTDLLVHARERTATGKPDPTTVRQVMTEAVFSVREDTSARSVVEQMVALNVRHLFVADPAGVVVGVITPLDVLKKLS